MSTYELDSEIVKTYEGFLSAINIDPVLEESRRIFWHNELTKFWTPLFIAIKNNIEPDKLYTIVYNAMYPFAPRMGNFSEEKISENTEVLISPLIRLTKSFLRQLWKAQKKEWNEIPQSEYFQPGTYVAMKKWEVLNIDFSEQVEIADFAERHRYEVVKFAGLDVSNMPTYLISYNKTERCARHSALELFD